MHSPVTLHIERINTQVGSAKYVILCNTAGGIINDPVLLRLSEDEFWFSIADSGAGLWLQGVNATGAYEVTIREIDVAPLSIAGKYALHTMRTLIGPQVDEIPYFGLMETSIAGCSVVVTRTGFSAEKNFEVFLRDAHRNADRLYAAVMEAGAPHGIREIAIPHHSRIEGGMLSYGQDMDIEVNPFEVGLGWQVNMSKDNFIGKAALMRIKEEGVTHRLAGLRVGGKRVDWYPADLYHVICPRSGDLVGYVTSMWYSPAQECNIALAFLPIDLAEIGAPPPLPPTSDALAPSSIRQAPPSPFSRGGSRVPLFPPYFGGRDFSVVLSFTSPLASCHRLPGRARCCEGKASQSSAAPRSDYSCHVRESP